jgi:hypothetical protein
VPLPWADLLRRVFAADVLACPCDGRRTVTAFVVDTTLARRVLTALGLAAEPATFAPGTRPTSGRVRLGRPRLAAARPAGDPVAPVPASPGMKPALLAAVRQDLDDSGTVLRMLKSYSDSLMHDPTTESGIFAKLHTLFKAGIGPEVMNGYYPGALVSWLGQGILGAFDLNSLNLTWKATRSFSPWTGKRFDPIDQARLAELTQRTRARRRAHPAVLQYRGVPQRARAHDTRPHEGGRPLDRGRLTGGAQGLQL